MEKLQKKVQHALQGYSVMQSIPRITAHSCSKGRQVRRGKTGKENSNQAKKTLATHAYACPPRICVLFNNPKPPLPHSSLTHPRICVAFYAYAYPLIHHPAQPSFYPKATLPTHMRALHAYACYHNTQHHHTPSCPTIFTLRPPFHAYASRSTHMRDTPLPTSPHSNLPTHYPRICVHSYAYAWDT
ncbi:hypothetical protein PIB30_099113 [Stylosanthes scabra]|uniref:Uncharacterized protein n=1 Tax=Stylosanthes scabra TaxID=79078 RepID=A0ABU6SZ56_9FABA|nr:hypothetical protein [Stylosanthes scabra]